MLAANEVSEIENASEEGLKAIVNVMNHQIGTLFLIGDRNRSIAVRDAAAKEILKRARNKRHQ